MRTLTFSLLPLRCVATALSEFLVHVSMVQQVRKKSRLHAIFCFPELCKMRNVLRHFLIVTYSFITKFVSQHAIRSLRLPSQNSRRLFKKRKKENDGKSWKDCPMFLLSFNTEFSLKGLSETDATCNLEQKHRRYIRCLLFSKLVLSMIAHLQLILFWTLLAQDVQKTSVTNEA